MGAELELYKGHRLSYFGSLSIAMLITEALRERTDAAYLRGLATDGSQRLRLILRFYDAADADAPGQLVRSVRLLDSLGQMDVQIMVNERPVHKGCYRIGELFGPVLARILRRLDPTEDDWAFSLRDADGQRTRPLPDVADTVDIDLQRPPRNLPFTVHQVEAPTRKGVDVAALGIDAGELAAVNVLVPGQVHEIISRRLPLSEQIEEGGFFLGWIRSAADAPQHRFAEITHITPAVSAGASAVHFTFTADSFQGVNQLMDERGRDEELIGWYHTHLFSADGDMGTGMGLSATDVDTHLSTFRRPGQVAGLINLFSGRRVLRFYGRAGNEIEECPVWIGDERGRYRPARSDLGGD